MQLTDQKPTTSGRPVGVRTTATLLGLLALVLAACGGSSESPTAPPAAAAAVTGSFVGKIAEADALVAVVAGGQWVRAYVCDGPGRQIAEYAEGPADGAHVLLTSRGGARFDINLAQNATGTVTMPGGRTLSFDAGPASGVAGLYELTFTPDGSFGGGSATGAALAGRVRDQQQVGADRIRYTVGGTVVAPDGTARPFTRLIEGDRAVAGTIALREILASSGESRGRGKGDAVSYTDKEIDL